ncbi:MAG: epimerase [Candidatus Nephthysia bennettiae]|uniref:NAD-dependent epimerase/dehydratase family protein n=1 Tax=Candidatus Nephthysia bennettiae TaxID=3127016 RepID=A0A934K9S4_9BACT|nr:NAD-dependent epimerase/dehydratase family protein [Candidatus Dormibacteraeota bacterium]MBJ7611785.1 NAD-dependent epimerase/dehydratase family protein [Candidatus Dormibacteraeota bacterium]PZR98297.1 MAG: epimerase [Candidatus Dormibacteraeota bacterium]
MKILVLGGTVFLGRHLVEAALERGHDVAMFNRGRSNPGLFPDVERLLGDRDGDLAALGGREWDAVVDLSGFVPRQVRAVGERLGDGAGHYTFLSSVSVYPDQADKSEDAPVRALEDPGSENVNRDYGGLKALCERTVEELYPGRALKVRSGLIAGPYDPTNRFTYWPVRLSAGGEVLAPDAPDLPVQYIDARDEAAWILDMAEGGASGTFNVTGPASMLTFGEFLQSCLEVTGANARFTLVPEGFLGAHGVQPWTDMPLWLPQKLAIVHSCPVERALAAGLRLRPLEQTIADTLAWGRQAGQAGPSEPQVDAGGRVRTPGGISPQREAELLRHWHGERG